MTIRLTTQYNLSELLEGMFLVLCVFHSDGKNFISQDILKSLQGEDRESLYSVY